MVSFPYYSHTIPIRIPKDMGMVWAIIWEAYHKGVPLLGVPLPILFPYYSHIFRDSYGSGIREYMGIVWGPRGPMSLGVPENRSH